MMQRKLNFVTASLNRDLKMMMRDGFLILIIIVPLLAGTALGILYRFLIPFLDRSLGLSLSDLLAREYLPLLHLFLILLPSIMTGMAGGFILLEEHEQGLNPFWGLSFRGPLRIFILRLPPLMSIYLISCWGSRVLFSLSAGLPFVFQPLLLIMGILEVPVFALFLAGNAANRVQGLALGKLISFFEMAPLAAYFLDGRIRYLFSVLPPFWMAEYLRAGRNEPLLLVLSLSVHLLWIFLCFTGYRKKLF
ncbi:hypothetical protein [Salinispira pacifica]|uniref:D-alanyl-D-alanine carboxypeptidase n=1 Tax=Salinispira pacifica TaxID=1307761 RepID=V5WG84_9SPIO|nr:hypothetical protein [Salinispira pacifica]AHC14176.1 D-alanyl-D-alanine carboxypeptidase [Salinispira pacifica]